MMNLCVLVATDDEESFDIFMKIFNKYDEFKTTIESESLSYSELAFKIFKENSFNYLRKTPPSSDFKLLLQHAFTISVKDEALTKIEVLQVFARKYNFELVIDMDLLKFLII